MSLRILADENMPMVDALFGGVGHSIKTLPGRQITRADVIDTDVLLVRSITRVDAALLADTAVRFVGTATIGTDHLDIPWLESQGIRWHNSPGCNAEAVVDYVIASLVYRQHTQGTSWRDKTVGVVGCGNVGGRLANRLSAAGVQVRRFDPPKQADRVQDHSRNPTLDMPEYSSWASVIDADILCFHTPLTHSGPHPTHHLLNAAAIAQLKPGTVIINAGRGPVIQQDALVRRMVAERDLTLIVDVWETEPNPDALLMSHTLLSTPHIAGYSLDGKIRGTWMLHAAFMAWMESEAVPEPISDIQLPQPYQWRDDQSIDANLYAAINQVFSISNDSERMRQALAEVTEAAARGQVFDQLRKHYPVRREFSCLVLQGVPEQDSSWIRALGFQCVAASSV